MTVQLNTTLRSNMVNQYESTVGTGPKLIFRTGAPPANCAAVDTGSFLGILTLPSDWMTASTGGSAAGKNGTWSGAMTNPGTIAHYRLKDSTATSTDNTGTTYEQGTVAIGSGDLSVDNNVVAAAQVVTVTQWDRTQGGA